jgi:hypothetical protein
VDFQRRLCRVRPRMTQQGKRNAPSPSRSTSAATRFTKRVRPTRSRPSSGRWSEVRLWRTCSGTIPILLTADIRGNPAMSDQGMLEHLRSGALMPYKSPGLCVRRAAALSPSAQALFDHLAAPARDRRSGRAPAPAWSRFLDRGPKPSFNL